MAVADWLWFAAYAGLTALVVIEDWRHRRVANGAVVALTALAGVLVAVGETEPLVESRWLALAVAGGVFGIGAALYALGLVGAGDAKLLVPVALIMTRLDPTSWLVYLGVFIVAGSVVLGVFGRRGDPLPLAPVIGLGVVPALLAAPPPWLS